MERKTFLKILGLTPFTGSMNTLSDLNKVSDSFSKSVKMPVLFLGHGSPMNAIEENEFVNGFRNAAKSIPTPNAILCVSAHWYIKGTKITAMEIPRTIHDFGGFPKALFDVQYPTKGNPELAKETQKLLQPTEVELDDKWGLDHGAWSVIKHLYPEANIPVIQLSIDYSKPASYHYELAGQLRSLRNKGVLIIGSGNIIHNLRLIDFHNLNKVDYGYDWAIEAHQKFNQLLLDGDYQSLVNYREQNSAVQLAIPTPDHFLPLIYTLGLQQKGESLNLFNDKLVGGSISMTSLKIS
ncbi:4,5-DOPA dioxygenase extradiol [Reichenbachiella sp. MALMAid0571]|uniref:4,5-DOPA-extradiol-dioxygenase n=1 Tax=Reichenbachiella sp. MALMAid0571 TaxID=3143939 RepID=UPI0032DFD685